MTQKRRFEGKTVLVTGGSRGFGLELARAFGAEGARVVVAARTPDDLQQAVAALGRACEDGSCFDVTGVTCDVRDDASVQSLVSHALGHTGHVDVLVNNAGVIDVGPLASMDREAFDRSLDTHFWGPYRLIEALRPSMRGHDARIVNVVSIGGRISVPHLLPYAVGKFALFGYSTGLRHALADEGISVTTVVPGLLRTGSPRNATFRGDARAEYAWFSVADSLPGLSMDAARAATKTVNAVAAKRALVMLGASAWIASRLDALAPGAMAAALTRAESLLPDMPAAGGDASRRPRAGREVESAWTRSALTWLTRRAARRNLEGEEAAPDSERDREAREEALRQPIDRDLAATFPASDAPSWSPVTSGAPSNAH